jgi:hypothetical protein
MANLRMIGRLFNRSLRNPEKTEQPRIDADEGAMKIEHEEKTDKIIGTAAQ